MMPIKHILLIALVFTTTLATAQIKDSIGFEISKDTSLEKSNDLYRIRIVNFKQGPIAIMHSAYINLWFDPPQRLAIFKKEGSLELISLHSAAKDTLADWENSNPNYNAEVVLPQQEIRFRIFIPHSDNQKRIVFEYINLPDYCYGEFRNAIYKNAATWYNNYKKEKIIFDLPK